MSKYSKEFKEEAIRLSDEIGNKKAAAQLGIPYYTLADWRNKSKHKLKEPELPNTALKCCFPLWRESFWRLWHGSLLQKNITERI